MEQASPAWRHLILVESDTGSRNTLNLPQFGHLCGSAVDFPTLHDNPPDLSYAPNRPDTRYFSFVIPTSALIAQVLVRAGR